MQQLRFQRLLAAFAVVAAAAPSLFAQGQTATLADGRVLTIKLPLEIYANEGPIWDVNVVNRSITAVGSTNTIPASIDGVPFTIAGTGYVNALGQVQEIGAQQFDRLLDGNAANRDASALYAGPARSIFSTYENRRTDAAAPATRNPQAQATAESNYFNYLQAAYPAHAAVLPADFLARAGVHGPDASQRVYPPSSGGTLKSAGHIYLDAQGNRFQIPDVEAVIELAENVRGGPVRSINAGGPGVPASFVIGDLLVIYNQDPRFPAHTLGVVEQEIPRSVLLQQGLGRHVDVVGHLVGEHVLFAQEVFTDLFDPNAPIIVTTERWLFNNQGREIRFRGIVDRPQGTTLRVTITDGATTINPIVPLAIDPENGTATYDFRSKNQLNVTNVTAVRVRLFQGTNAPLTAPVLFDQTFLRSEVIGL
jgi:hypothetical protein